MAAAPIIAGRYIAPAGAPECSHGWSGAEAKPTGAEPVDLPNQNTRSPGRGEGIRAAVIPARSSFRRPSGTVARESHCVPRVTLRSPDGGLRSTRGYSPPPHSGLKTRIEVLSPSCIRTVAYEDTEHFLANPQRTLSLLMEGESACDQVSTADDA